MRNAFDLGDKLLNELPRRTVGWLNSNPFRVTGRCVESLRLNFSGLRRILNSVNAANELVSVCCRTVYPGRAWRLRSGSRLHPERRRSSQMWLTAERADWLTSTLVDAKAARQSAENSHATNLAFFVLHKLFLTFLDVLQFGMLRGQSHGRCWRWPKKDAFCACVILRASEDEFTLLS